MVNLGRFGGRRRVSLVSTRREAYAIRGWSSHQTGVAPSGAVTTRAHGFRGHSPTLAHNGMRLRVTSRPRSRWCELVEERVGLGVVLRHPPRLGDLPVQ